MHDARQSRDAVATAARGAMGLTLVELLITLVIALTVASIALPMFGDSDQTLLRGASSRLLSDLEFAQVDSMVHASDRRIVVFDTAKGRYFIAASSNPDTPISNPLGRVPYDTRFGAGSAAYLKGVTFGAVSVGGDNRLGFGKFGELDQLTAATITLRAHTASVTLTVDPVTGQCSVGPIK